MQIARLLLAVTGSGMALVLLVVLLIYAVYMGEKPTLARDLPLLAFTTVVFTLLGGCAATASWGRAKARPWAWRWDLALLLLLPLGIFVLIQAYA
ncbi:MAG: hypothetical protein ACPHCJ_01015 [Oceanococcaceae bacterium]